MTSFEFPTDKTRFTRSSRPEVPFVTAVVNGVNPNLFTVNAVAGQDKVYSNIPILDTYGTYFNNDVTWLKSLLGTNVILMWIIDRYYVLGTLPFESKHDEETLGQNISDGECGGKDEESYKKLRRHNFSGRRSTDFYEADKVLRAGSGGELGLFREGVARLKAGPLAQFILGRFKEFGKLVTRIFSHFSDFGEVNHIHNDEGRVGLNVKGGAVYEDETDPENPKWTVQAWLGDYPDDEDSRLHVRVNSKNNVEFIELTMDINGDFKLETSQDDIQMIGNNRDHEIDEDFDLSIGNDYTIKVGNDLNIEVKGNKDEEIGSDYKLKVGEDLDIEVESDKDEEIGSNYTVKVGDSLDIDVQSSKDERVGSNYSLNVNGNLDISVNGSANIESSSMVSISAPMVSIN